MLIYQRAASICAAANVAMHKEMDMLRALERLIDRLMAPFAEELARMPASAFRQLLSGH